MKAEDFAATDSPWIISTQHNSEPYSGVVVANGRIGMLSDPRPFKTKYIVLNNVYDKESPLGVSKILFGMNFGNLDMEINGEKVSDKNISDWQQSLNMKTGSLTTSFRFKEMAAVSYTLYALRNIPFAGYIDIEVEALIPIELKVTGKIETPLDYCDISSSFRVMEDLETTMPILQTVAKSPYRRHDLATSATFIWHSLESTRAHSRPKLFHEVVSEMENRLSFEMQVDKGDTLTFAWTGAICTTQDFSDPRSESERFVIFNLLTPREDILNAHKAAWEELWKGDIIIEGDLQSQRDVRLALYHLYAFSREDANLSIAPMGLSSHNYNGHIFWDTELWMFPPLLLLNPGIAKSLLAYRSDRLAAAKRKAINHGYKGAMFPWESDDTGEEATPTWALTGTFEHHITACIGIAFWNYFRMTQDRQWLEAQGYPMLKEVADFWVSRAIRNDNGSYSIKNVVGANEFAPNVDDNAFTNGAAITVLQYATQAAKALGHAPNPEWELVSKLLKIHRFPDGTTMEHSRYAGDRIKQADVNLLAYPLEIVTNPETVKKDLAYYEPRMAEEGPAMSQSVLAVIYARMGDAENAFRLFKRCYEPNKRPPFGALAESALSHNPYFATGAGGLLQVVLFGFAGLHIEAGGIVQKNPVLPKKWKSLTIRGVGPEGKEIVVR